MSHRAALYRLRIRPKRQVRGWCLLGDYDEAGTWVGETIQKALMGQTSTNYDRTVEATFGEELLPRLPPNTVGVQILSGKSGVSSVLTRGGLTRFVRTPDDSEVMRSAALFSLPPHRTEGWLVVHVPHRRGCKTILHDALRANFGERGYVISITPFVPEDAFRALIDQARVSKVTLTKRELERSDRFAEAAQWGDNKLDRIELTFRGRRLRSLNKDPIRRFLAKPSEETRNRIIEFGGLQFDDAASNSSYATRWATHFPLGVSSEWSSVYSRS